MHLYTYIAHVLQQWIVHVTHCTMQSAQPYEYTTPSTADVADTEKPVDFSTARPTILHTSCRQ
jgi:hypothetical protein